MLGCQEDAETAYLLMLEFGRELKEAHDAADYVHLGVNWEYEGWKFIGMGGCRFAFLAPSGVLYKTPNPYMNDEFGFNNVDEHERIREILELLEERGMVRCVPLSDSYTVHHSGDTTVCVLAVEYFDAKPAIADHDWNADCEGKGLCVNGCIDILMNQMGELLDQRDRHDSNFLIRNDTGQMVCVDLV